MKTAYKQYLFAAALVGAVALTAATAARAADRKPNILYFIGLGLPLIVGVGEVRELRRVDVDHFERGEFIYCVSEEVIVKADLLLRRSCSRVGHG